MHQNHGNKKNIMKNILLFSIGLLLLSSCNLRSSGCRCNNIIGGITWTLENEILREAIIEFANSVPLEGEGFISLTYFHLNDSTIKFRISYITNWFDLRFPAPLLFFHVNEHLVGFDIDNLWHAYRFFGADDVILLSDTALINIMRSNFPKQYEYYLKHGEFPFMRRERPIVMDLTFRYSELIEKRLVDLTPPKLTDEELESMGFNFFSIEDRHPVLELFQNRWRGFVIRAHQAK